MGFLKKIFGGRTMEEEQAHGEELFKESRFGEAKLAFEKALEKAKDASQDLRTKLRDRADESCDGLAQQRIEEAERCLEHGNRDLARGELEGALEIVVSKEVRAAAQKIVDQLEGADAVAEAQVVAVSDEERLAALAGTWEDEQGDEYESYGKRFEDALLRLHEGKAEAALEILESVVEDAGEARFLWFEVGRAAFAANDEKRAEDALVAFLDCLDEEEGGAARLTAHELLSRVFENRGDDDAAMEELETAAAIFDEDTRPLLSLGRFLRRKERPEEAREVLELATNMSEQPRWEILQELGLAHRDLKQNEQAIGVLEGVVDFFTANRVLNYPPTTAIPLAELYESQEKFERAADLYGALTRGEDRGNHHVYHYRAGKMLLELDLEEEAHRMLKRAAILAEDRSRFLDELVETDAYKKAAESEPEAQEEEVRRARQSALETKQKAQELLGIAADPTPVEDAETTASDQAL